MLVLKPMSSAISSPPRADCLDALRGYAILTMALSGLVPWGPLPQWMYHAQLIAPQMKYDLTVPGLTWVDLVFPFFLFSMGAAIPLALGARWTGAPATARMVVLAGLVKRSALLAFFAIFVQHFAPTTIANPPGPRAWWTALLGFTFLFGMFARLPSSWKRGRRFLVRGSGWLGGLVLLAALNFRAESPIAGTAQRIVATSDIIILVLANVSLAGGGIWLLTRRSIVVRLGLMLAIVLIRLGHSEIAALRWLWDFTPLPWLYRFHFLQYLLIVLPGTIAGELLLRIRGDIPENIEIRPKRAPVLALLLLTVIVVTVAGLQARELAAAMLAAGLLLGGAAACLWRVEGVWDQSVRRLFVWGVVWLALGLALEPYEGGIKKDHPTLSYYFVTSGLASFALLVFSLAIERLGLRRRLRPLVDVGQNPLIAYAGIRSLLAPVAALTGLDALLSTWLTTPWLGVLRAALKTALLTVFVCVCTRRRIVWRA